MKIVFQIGKKPVCAIHYKETNRTTQKKMTHNKCMTVVDLFELAQSQVEVIFKKKKKCLDCCSSSTQQRLPCF